MDQSDHWAGCYPQLQVLVRPRSVQRGGGCGEARAGVLMRRREAASRALLRPEGRKKIQSFTGETSHPHDKVIHLMRGRRAWIACAPPVRPLFLFFFLFSCQTNVLQSSGRAGARRSLARYRDREHGARVFRAARTAESRYQVEGWRTGRCSPLITPDGHPHMTAEFNDKNR